MTLRLAWMTVSFVGVALLCAALPLATTGGPVRAAVTGLAGLVLAVVAGSMATRRSRPDAR